MNALKLALDKNLLNLTHRQAKRCEFELCVGSNFQIKIETTYLECLEANENSPLLT